MKQIDIKPLAKFTTKSDAQREKMNAEDRRIQ